MMLCGKSCSIIIFFMVVLYNINIEERYIVQRTNSVMLCGKSCSIIILLW